MHSHVLQAFRDVKGNGAGWIARCPAHEDERSSLSIGRGEDGRVLLHCHAGCATPDILRAAGLTMSDLFAASTSKTTRTIIATYDYVDEQGCLLFQSVRYLPKDFRQRRPDGRGGWTWNMRGVPRVLYRLPELLGQPMVLVLEGEKDADTLASLNFAATTNPGGAGKWKDEYAQTLHAAGVRVVGVIPDNDETGGKHAMDVVRTCRAAGLIARVISLPDLPPKGDVGDFLRVHTADDLKAIITAALSAEVTERLAAPSTDAADFGTALSNTETLIRQYVVLSPEQAALTTLWTAQTHAMDAFDYAAYVNITSPMPECGKTRLLEVLDALVAKPWFTGRVTAAVLMRKMDAEHPTLLLDESDAAFTGDPEYSEGLRGMLNSGFHRSGKASVCSGQGANLTYKDFSTFGPKAIAGIGKLPSTVRSRSIPIALKRRTKDEAVLKWRRREAWASADPLRVALSTIGCALVETLRNARPALPDGLGDRAEDVLEPLFAIADLAGGTWPQRARQAALTLMGYAARVEQESEQAVGLELLADIRSIYIDKDNPEILPTKDIIAGLQAFEDRPWATFGKGDKPITAHRLSRLLRGFDVHPGGDFRIGDKVLKSYRRSAFEEAFARYLPSEAQHRNNPNKTGAKPSKTEAQHGTSVADAKNAVSPDKHWVCSDVADSTPDMGLPLDKEEDDDASYYSGA